MPTHDPYMAKTIEYLTCVAFLLAFTAFWRYVNGAPVMARAAAWSGQIADWFRLPADCFFHPGHGWVREAEAGLLSVGVDDFAQQLVGPLAGLALPKRGDRITAGQRAWAVQADSKTIDMLAPVSGTVVEVNESALANPALVNTDPYGAGWLFKVQAPKPARALQSLLSGNAARRWLDRVTSELTLAMSPELGLVAQDGGLPVHGLARAIDDAHWDDVARKFLLS